MALKKKRKTCTNNQKKIDNKRPLFLIKRRKTDDLLTIVNKNAFQFILNDHKKIFEEMKKYLNLNERARRLGINLFKIRNYLCTKVPLLIFNKFERDADQFLNDTHYRNLFEVGRSNGHPSQEYRIEWEKTLFGNSYSSVSGFDRVKYGVVDVFQLEHIPLPNRSLDQYGQHYFRLKPIHHRVTVTFGDSSIAKCAVLLDYFDSLFFCFEDDDLSELHRIAIGKPTTKKDTKLTRNFFEIQIHGPILFNRDIDALVIHTKYLREEEKEFVLCKAKKFAEKNDCKLEIKE